MNIIIQGKPGVGKTTLLNKLICNIDKPIKGVITKKATVDSVSGIYMYPFGDEMSFDKTNLVGICGDSGAVGFAEAFNQLGCRYLSDVSTDDIVVLDELGYMESNAQLFKRRVMEILDNDCNVIAVIKPMHIPFLDMVRKHPKSAVYEIDEKNRDELFYTIFTRHSFLH